MAVTVAYHQEDRLGGGIVLAEAIPLLRGNRDETGRAMTEASERRADTTRQRLIAAAAHQFARRSYSMVNLDDILADAELTKGAMYFHFPSKQALASAIIDELTELGRATASELLARKMSGLETLIDLFYRLAVQDIEHEVARAGARLVDTLDNTTAGTRSLLESWVEFVTTLVERAVAEGDIPDDTDPQDVAKMLVAVWAGIRRISDLDQPEHYLDNLQRVWLLALPGFTNQNRIDYFRQFIKRRHTIALKRLSLQALSDEAAAVPTDPASTSGPSSELQSPAAT